MGSCKKKKKKARNKHHPQETNSDAVYTDNLTLLVNIPAKAESRLYNLEQAARDFDSTWTRIKRVLNEIAPSPH